MKIAPYEYRLVILAYDVTTMGVHAHANPKTCTLCTRPDSKILRRIEIPEYTAKIREPVDLPVDTELLARVNELLAKLASLEDVPFVAVELRYLARQCQEESDRARWVWKFMASSPHVDYPTMANTPDEALYRMTLQAAWMIGAEQAQKEER